MQSIAISSAAKARLAVLAIALVIRLAFYSGYQGEDDRGYTAYARYYVQHLQPLLDESQWIGRIGVWLPMALADWLVGASSIGLYSLACSLAGVYVIMRLCEELTDCLRTSVISGTILAALPLDVIYGTTNYADTCVSFWMVLSLYWFILATRHQERATRYFLLAGFAAGVAYLSRITALTLLFPFAIVALRGRFFWRCLLPGLSGILAVVAVECCFWTAHTGNPIYRYDAAKTVVQARQGKLADTPESVIPRPLPHEIYRHPNSILDLLLMFAVNEEFGLLFYFAWPAIAVLASTRQRSTFGPLITWCVVLTLFLGFFPFNWPRHTLPRDPRYFLPVAACAIVCLAQANTLYLSKWLQWCMTGCLIVTSVLGLALTQSTRTYSAEKQAAAIAVVQRGSRVWVSPTIAWRVALLTDFKIPDHVGVHFLEVHQRSHIWKTLAPNVPPLPILESTDAIDPGDFIVVERKMQGFALAQTVSSEHPAALRFAAKLLNSLGVEMGFRSKSYYIYGNRSRPSAGNV
jgi:hypothetical protein